MYLLHWKTKAMSKWKALFFHKKKKKKEKQTQNNSARRDIYFSRNFLIVRPHNSAYMHPL